ncbi:winged helix-turn-helix domain-containing protein [Entomohabitans teleogrylli]|uniref:winged helix-turn-helix domain-containing protein n=1 Tax=Entomohabitans teleogrylli TaxID=1384589 RepID=UPI00073D47BB|nr:winged helix-turn-helix domain-containing protein [Entomohabitans teleogrylli]
MEYLIENCLCYRPDDGVLWLRDNNHSDDKVILTATLNRLLLILIRHQGETMRREDILRYVWEDYGLDSSNNSLNQYVSILRKIFLQFGLGNYVIITKPREGFFFSDEITVIPDPAAGVETADPLTPESRKATNPLSDPVRKVVSSSGIVWILVTFLFLGILPFLAWHLARFHSGTIPETRTVRIGEYQGCEVNFIPGYGNTDTLPPMALVKKVYQTSGMTCHPPGMMYFYADVRSINNIKGKVFLSTCTLIGNQLSACREYMAHDWETK